MNTQKNAAWYRHQSWHRQTIIPALMPCSNGAWRFLPLPDRAKHKQKKARNYAGLAAFHAIRCLAVPDAESFPLDRSGRFGGDVVDDAVDAADFVDDARRDAAEEVVREGIVIRRHAVGRGDGAQRTDVIIGAVVAHHAHGTDGEQHGEGLPDLAVEPGVPDLLKIDGVGLAEDIEPLPGDGAGDANGKARPREGMPIDEFGRHAKLAAKHADLVLEKLAKRLDELHIHPLGQAADIMVRLDGDAGSAGEGDALDHIGVKRALGKKFGAADLARLRLEHIDEEPADGLALGFRIFNAGKLAKEEIGRVAVNERNIVMIAEEAHHLLRFARAHQPGIDINAGQLIADRLMDEDGGHRAVDAARKAADDL